MLGEVLIKADKTWYKGSGFKLKNDIKKAKKEFQIFREIFKEFDQINSSILQGLINNKQLFLKEFPRIKNILKIHQDYQPILDNIFHNFNYFIQNFDLIEEWLLSDDFKERYKKENHPYPSLLDPKKLNDENEKINYHNIPAELAWEMNLPLPENKYKFFLITFGASAHYTYIDFFKRYLKLNICELHFNFFDSIDFDNLYRCCEKRDILVLCIWFLTYNASELYKYKIFYIMQNISFIIVTRDPISRLKTMINHGGSNESNKLKIYENYIHCVHRKKFPYLNNGVICYKNVPDITAAEIFINGSKYVNYDYSKIANICRNNTYYFDASEIDPDNVFQSMIKFSSFFDKEIDKKVLIEEMEYLREKKHTDLYAILPIIITFNNEFEIIIDINYITEYHPYNITYELFDNNISRDFKICTNNYDYFYENILHNSSLLKNIKDYLSLVIKEIELVKNNILEHKILENNILNYFRSHRNIYCVFKSILDIGLSHIKQHRPDIVASWKYYQEFEKMCKELDGDI